MWYRFAQHRIAMQMDIIDPYRDDLKGWDYDIEGDHRLDFLNKLREIDGSYVAGRPEMYPAMHKFMLPDGLITGDVKDHQSGGWKALYDSGHTTRALVRNDGSNQYGGGYTPYGSKGLGLMRVLNTPSIDGRKKSIDLSIDDIVTPSQLATLESLADQGYVFGFNYPRVPGSSTSGGVHGASFYDLLDKGLTDEMLRQGRDFEEGMKSWKDNPLLPDAAKPLLPRDIVSQMGDVPDKRDALIVYMKKLKDAIQKGIISIEDTHRSPIHFQDLVTPEDLLEYRKKKNAYIEYLQSRYD